MDFVSLRQSNKPPTYVGGLLNQYFNTLLIVGSSASGKTKLAVSLAKEAIDGGMEVAYLTRETEFKDVSRRIINCSPPDTADNKYLEKFTMNSDFSTIRNRVNASKNRLLIIIDGDFHKELFQTRHESAEFLEEVCSLVRMNSHIKLVTTISLVKRVEKEQTKLKFLEIESDYKLVQCFDCVVGITNDLTKKSYQEDTYVRIMKTRYGKQVTEPILMQTDKVSGLLIPYIKPNYFTLLLQIFMYWISRLRKHKIK